MLINCNSQNKNIKKNKDRPIDLFFIMQMFCYTHFLTRMWNMQVQNKVSMSYNFNKLY